MFICSYVSGIQGIQGNLRYQFLIQSLNQRSKIVMWLISILTKNWLLKVVIIIYSFTFTCINYIILPKKKKIIITISTGIFWYNIIFYLYDFHDRNMQYAWLLDYLVFFFLFFLCPIFSASLQQSTVYLEKIIAEMIIIVQQKNLSNKKNFKFFIPFISSEVYCKTNIFLKSPSITNESSKQNKYVAFLNFAN